MEFIWVQGSKYQKRITDYLYSVDDIMIPRLRNRVNVSEYAKKLANKAETLFVNLDNIDIASCSIYCNTPIAFISSIAVKKEYLRQHVGEKMMFEIKRHLQGKNFEAIRLELHQDNIAALHYYMKNNFSCIESHPPWITMECRNMYSLG